MAKKAADPAAKVVNDAARKAKPAGKARGPVRKDTALSAMKSSLRRHHDNGDMILSGPAERVFCGVPLPSLSLMYLMESTVFPLGRFVQLAGLEGSCKSSFMAEVCRWVLACQGTGRIMETEAKDIARLRNGILERRTEWIDEALGVKPAMSLEAWMRGVNESFDEIESICGEFGWTVPCFIGIDSVVGSSSEKVQQQVQKDGAPESNFPDTPRHITTFLGTVPNRIFRRPIALVGTNHLKPGQDRRGFPTEKYPGGRALAFYSTYIIRLRRVRYIEATQKYGGVEIEMFTRKNSAGQGEKQITVKLLWKILPTPDGGSVYYAYWDWAGATIQMLLDTKKESAATWNAINKVVDLHIVEKRNTVWSDVLGIPEKKPLRFSEAGAILEQRGDLIRQLMPLLYINPNPAFVPDERGIDYDGTIAEGPTDIEEVLGIRPYHPLPLSDFGDIIDALSAQPTVEELKKKAMEEYAADNEDPIEG